MVARYVQGEVCRRRPAGVCEGQGAEDRFGDRAAGRHGRPLEEAQRGEAAGRRSTGHVELDFRRSRAFQTFPLSLSRFTHTSRNTQASSALEQHATADYAVPTRAYIIPFPALTHPNQFCVTVSTYLGHSAVPFAVRQYDLRMFFSFSPRRFASNPFPPAASVTPAQVRQSYAGFEPPKYEEHMKVASPEQLSCAYVVAEAFKQAGHPIKPRRRDAGWVTKFEDKIAEYQKAPPRTLPAAFSFSY